MNIILKAQNVHYEIMLSLPFSKLEKLVDEPIWVASEEQYNNGKNNLLF